MLLGQIQALNHVNCLQIPTPVPPPLAPPPASSRIEVKPRVYTRLTVAVFARLEALCGVINRGSSY